MANLKKIGDTYYADIRIDGERLRPALSTDKRVAEDKLADMVKMRQAKKHGDPLGDLGFEAFETRYMIYSATKNPRTHDIDKLAFRKLKEAVRLPTIHSLTPERLQAFSDWLHGQGGAIGTQNRMVHAIKAAINKAIEWNMLPANLSYRKVKLRKEVKGKLIFLELPEVNKLIAGTRGHWRTIAMLGYYLGLRRTEMYYLKTKCLDYKRKRVHIEPTDEFTPKDFERRFIPMHKKLYAYLKKNVNGSEYVLGQNRPEPYKMTKDFAVLMKNLGLAGSLHTLRHTFGSHCAMAGIPIPTIAKWMGHASTKTTEIYAHLSPEHLDDMMTRYPGLK